MPTSKALQAAPQPILGKSKLDVTFLHHPKSQRGQQRQEGRSIQTPPQMQLLPFLDQYNSPIPQNHAAWLRTPHSAALGREPHTSVLFVLWSSSWQQSNKHFSKLPKCQENIYRPHFCKACTPAQRAHMHTSLGAAWHAFHNDFY